MSTNFCQLYAPYQYEILETVESLLVTKCVPKFENKWDLKLVIPPVYMGWATL